MMKKLIAALLIAVMVLTAAVAFAEQYEGEDITFTYDENAFEITTDEVDDGGHFVVLNAKEEAWGKTYIRFYVYMEEEDGQFSSVESLQELLPDIEITQGEWNGFNDVIMYNDGTEQLFLVPLTTGEQMTVGICVTEIEDEDVAMERDDQISAVLDTLKIVADAEG